VRAVTPGYFDLLGQSIVEGRDFEDGDDGESPNVAVVNEAFVDRYLDGSDALGRRISQWNTTWEIVGVVSDARIDDLTRAAEPEVYGSLWQRGAFTKHLVLSTTLDPNAAAVIIQQALQEISSTVAVENVATLGQIRAESVAARSFAMQLLLGFAVVACLLTLAGIYGVLSLSVGARRREIAIRTAVGAEKRDVIGLVFREGVSVIAVGIVIGIVASVALSRVLGVFLFGVEPTDPLTLGVVGTLFAAVALLACFLPARRAAQADPMVALQDD
jgi:putative ABC transport system permease protein